MSKKYMIAITGSIGTGKSTVCKILKQKGYKIIDADKISHKILEQSSKEVAKIFGKEFLDENGKPDRKKLGKLVFADKNKKEILENLLHSKIFESIKKEAEPLEKIKKIYFLDIPLLFEVKNSYNHGFVCVVYAPKEIEIKRVMDRNNIDRSEALAKIDSQIDIEIKKQKADFVIDNSEDETHLINEVESFLKKLRKEYESCEV
ncbi:MAG: dephospho-CoA kinase [Campylobacteraceae bacterium]|jgi:dephospho-CoA kinase|nr:dephospho-CoA kinase [Campylobacteraceae bacterium]